MERWDLFDASRMPLNKSIARGDALPPGSFHQIIGVWVVAEKEKAVLLTQRAYSKSICPGLWENTGGSVLAGETPSQAAVREVYEETGIKIEEKALRWIRTFQTETAFIDSYVVTIPCIESVRLQPEETIDYQWLPGAQLDAFVHSEAFATPIVKQYEGARFILDEVVL